jgi:hypothetical protein
MDYIEVCALTNKAFACVVGQHGLELSIYGKMLANTPRAMSRDQNYKAFLRRHAKIS